MICIKIFLRKLRILSVAIALSLLATPLVAQVDNDLCRHFIISIDKYPHTPYPHYVYNNPIKIIDATDKLLTEKFKITEKDYVSILFYGIGINSSTPTDLIFKPQLDGMPLQWMSGSQYKDTWTRFHSNRPSLSNGFIEKPFSMQAASKELSYLLVSDGNERRCNQTYLLRITDNEGNTGDKLNPREDFKTFIEHGSRIDMSEWLRVTDTVQNHYFFNRPDIGNDLYVIDNLVAAYVYGIYTSQVVQKEKPNINTVLDFNRWNVSQIKQGHLVSFDFDEKGAYNVDRFQVSYQIGDDLYCPYDTVSVKSGHVEFIIPDTYDSDSLSVNLKVWASSKTARGAMVINPYDCISGNHLNDERQLVLEYATIFGMPLTKNWIWFSNDPRLTALIWTVLLVIVAVVLLFAAYFFLRKYKVTKENVSIDVAPIPMFRVNLLNPAEEKVSVFKVGINVKKPFWSKGRSIYEKVAAEISIKLPESEGFIIEGEALSISEKSIVIRDYHTDIDIYALKSAFKDYNDAQTSENRNSQYPLTFSLSLKDSRGSELVNKTIDLNVAFEVISHDPKIRITDRDGAETDRFEVTYRRQGEDILGSCQFVKDCELRRAPRIATFTPSLHCDDCDAIRIENGQLLLDYSRLNNFNNVNFIDYHYDLKYEYKESGYQGGKFISRSFVLRVKRNPTEPSLRVKYQDRRSNDEWRCLDNGAIGELSKIEFIPGDNICEFRNRLVIENAATEGPQGSCIRITGLNITPEVKGNNELRYDSEAFIFDNREYPDQIRLESGDVNNQICSTVGWNAKDRNVDYINDRRERQYEMTVKISITFSYSIDRLGNGEFEDEKEYSASLIYIVFQGVHREWLGIDFGTSAIVALYSGDRDVKDLRGVKDGLYREEVFNDDTYEAGTRFLPSNVIFKFNEGESQRCYPAGNDNTDYHSAAVCLSPTSSLEQNFYQGILPCLKLMVGYEELPMLNAFKGRQYIFRRDNPQEERIVEFGAENENPLAKVENIFHEVYSQLLTFFIFPTMADIQFLDNVVLTVPNTYTSSHLRILEECIRNTSIGENVRNIKFVSESDAVACYYQSNWARLNLGRTPLTDENILVYDMGAGTLDISMLHRVVKNNSTKIDVIGKIGVGRAGNYLDTLLAETLASNYPDTGLSEYLNKPILDTKPFKIASAWKHFIKDILKPSLNSGGSISLVPSEHSELDLEKQVDISLDDILDSDQYKEYVRLCSSEILENFFGFQGFDKNGNKPRIDTLILSGRASNQNRLIEGIKSVLKDWCGKEATVISLWQGEHDTSKTAVIEGAISRISRFAGGGVEFNSNNITADYGIIYEDMTGRTCYLKLLNHRDKPNDMKTIAGVRHYMYDKVTSHINLTAVEKITLIQTYTDNPVSENGSLSEYCTVMDSYFIPNDANKQDLRIGIQVNQDGQIILSIDGAAAAPQAATQVDIESELYQKGLWPMMGRV